MREWTIYYFQCAMGHNGSTVYGILNSKGIPVSFNLNCFHLKVQKLSGWFTHRKKSKDCLYISALLSKTKNMKCLE